MAYVAETTDQAQQPGANPSTSMNQLPSTSSAGGGATAAGGGGSGQGTTAVPNATKAPPVQDLQAYLTANQPQAVQMGQNIATGLNNQTAQVTGDINKDQASIDAQVQAQDVGSNYAPTIQAAAANPTEFVQDPNNVSQFQQFLNANYTGPTTFESTPEYQTLTTEVANAKQNAPDINTSAGVNQLVRGQETNPTLGMSNLDQLLLQGTPEAMSPIAAAEAPIANLGTQLSGATTAEDAAIQNAIANDQAAPQAVNSAFLTGTNAVVPAWETGLQNELSQAQTGANAYNTDLQSYINFLNQNQPFKASLDQSGLESLIGGNPFTPAPSAQTNSPTLANVATSQDYATEAALSQLLGSGLGTTPIDQSTVGQAGSYALPGTVPANEDIKGILSQITGALSSNLPVSVYDKMVPNGGNTLSGTWGADAMLAALSNPQIKSYEDLLNAVSSEYPQQGYVKPIPTSGGLSFTNPYYEMA